MFFVGIDVHACRSSICILNDDGKVVKEELVRGDMDALVLAVEQLPGSPSTRVLCFEASTGCGVLCDRLMPLAKRIEVAHPGKVRLIFQAKRKNDRIDAHKLAKLLFLDEVPRAYIPDAKVRAWRGLVEFRGVAVDKRTRAKNQLRTLLKNCGMIEILRSHSRPRKSLWSRKGVAALAELSMVNAEDQLRLDLLIGELMHLESEVKQVEKRLDELALDHAGVALLQSIPGVGPRTAEAVLAYVDRPARFQRNKQIGSYFGLVPCQDSSAEVNRLGHITRQGPPTVRKLLTEAAWQGIRHSPTLKAYYDRLTQGKKERNKIALVATAHHLVRVMLAMLKSGEVWREEVAENAESSVTASAGMMSSRG